MKLLEINNESWNVLAELGALSLVYVAFVVILIASVWRIFVKAGRKGWLSIIPFYNVIVMLEITGKPSWWIFLILIPVVDLVPIIIVLHSLSLRFDKGVGTTLLMFVAGIGLITLGFGDAKYVGPVNAEA